MPDDDLIYEPERRPRRRRNADTQVDADGNIVEYERGYLRAQAKAARGVPSKARRPKAPPFMPPIVPDCGITILYVLELGRTPAAVADDLRVEIWWRPTEGQSALRPLTLDSETTVPAAADQRLLQLLHPHLLHTAGTRGNACAVPVAKQQEFLEALAAAAEVRWSARRDEAQWRLHRLSVHTGPTPWFFALPDGRPRLWLGAPERDYDLRDWRALGQAGWVIAGDHLYPVRISRAFGLLASWMASFPAVFPAAELSNAIRTLTLDGGADLTALPETMRCPVGAVEPTGRLYIAAARFKHLGQEQLQCDLTFDYAGAACAPDSDEERLSTPGGVILRDHAAETRLAEELRRLGFRLVTRTGGDEDPGWKLLPSQLDAAVRTLVLAGWEITAEGKNYRRPVSKDFTVASFGIDWLEVDASLDFGTAKAELPLLLQAARKGQKSVRLDDGTYGILPQEWLERFTALVEIGESDSQRVRLRQRQAALLQAILAEQLHDADGRYTALLRGLDALPAPAPLDATPEFHAALRPYQKTALGWLRGLQQAGLGGILADDMGLGKTIEVLSLLEMRHHDAPGRPSLIVMPSSLLFNWEAECRRFAPHLTTACHHGPSRTFAPEWFARHDLVFTTYGTLRQDAARLADIHFDYVVLDESQAIKNASSATAEAARALRAEHRVAMTGTPIENHLAELFSQLAFLNPGLFSERFVRSLGRETALFAPGGETAARLRRSVAPFLLRRRKEEVATDLPPKTEQILWCELDEPQRRCYDDLRDFYRRDFAEGANAPQAASMLAALLRLRQAACHAGLVNPACAAIPSAKIELLNAQLEQLLEAGHKALVFSQFTTLLKFAAAAFDARGWNYCYLDGATENRGELVQRFQTEPETRLFLISLKAGGVGLNLTAADYVFLLDPWWNPAAEAQAIDRAYRIGQTRPVFAYRLIARDTIEEKVRFMQEQKRAIAGAALPDGSAPVSLTPDLFQELLR